MRIKLNLFLIMFFIIVIGSTCTSASTNVVPRDGTVYLGEEGLDLSNTGVRSGSEIAWWGGSEPSGMPQDRYTVLDTKDFDVSYDIFGDRPGSWYTLEGKELAFTVEEPSFVLEVEESGLDTGEEWIKRGNLITFDIKSNLIGIANRIGSTGIPVTIVVTGPNETTFTQLKPSSTETFKLENFLAYYDPYSTGAIWDTDLADYPDGEYTIWAYTNVNNVNDHATSEGKTRTEKQVFTLQKTDPKFNTPKPSKTPAETESDKLNSKEEEETDESEKLDSEEDIKDTGESEKLDSEESEEETDKSSYKVTAESIDNEQEEKEEVTSEEDKEIKQESVESTPEETPEPVIIMTTPPTPVPKPEVRVTPVQKVTIQPPRHLSWEDKSEVIPVTTTQKSSLPGILGCIGMILALLIIARKK